MRHRLPDRPRLPKKAGAPSRSFSVGGTVTAVVAVLLATALLGLHMFGLTPEEEAPTETVVVEVAMTDGEAVAVKAAKSVGANVNLPVLRQLDDASVAQVQDRLDLIETHLSARPTQNQFLVFEGVPADVAEACREGKVGAWKLLTTAETRSVVSTPAHVEGQASMAIPHRPTAHPSEVQQAVAAFEQSVETLPLRTQLQILDEDQVSFEQVTDEEIDAILADSEVPAVRSEANRRLAGTLPDLSEAENGKLDPELLCPIPWVSSYYKVLCPALPNLVALNEAFKAEFGHDLAIQSAYRDYGEQQAAHAAAPTMTTLPGTSNHSWGVAVDFDIAEYRSYDHPEVVWLVENAPTYGWRNPKHESFETRLPEPWHYEFGTKYNDDPDWGFLGPIPDEPFLIKWPEDHRTTTIYSN